MQKPYNFGHSPLLVLAITYRNLDVLDISYGHKNVRLSVKRIPEQDLGLLLFHSQTSQAQQHIKHSCTLLQYLALAVLCKKYSCQPVKFCLWNSASTMPQG